MNKASPTVFCIKVEYSNCEYILEGEEAYSYINTHMNHFAKSLLIISKKVEFMDKNRLVKVCVLEEDDWDYISKLIKQQW